jgi:site-specific recombinase XerD
MCRILGGVELDIVAGGVELDVLAGAYRARSLATNTMRAYAADWRRFSTWCATVGEADLPASAQTLQRYLSASAGTSSPATLARWLCGIARAHSVAGVPSAVRHPAVRETMAGIRRVHGVPPRRVAPLLLEDLRVLLGGIDCSTWPNGVAGRRDAAILTLGFVGAFRRSELAALSMRDLVVHRHDGLRVRVGRSKTDQDAQGRTVALPRASSAATCAPCAAVRWAQLVAVADAPRAVRMRALLGQDDCGEHCCRSGAGLQELGGSAFLRTVTQGGVIGAGHISGQVVNAVVRRRATQVRLELSESMGGHSMRAGFVTEAFRAGADVASIMRQTGQKSAATVEIYRREHSPLVGNAVTRLDL